MFTLDDALNLYAEMLNTGNSTKFENFVSDDYRQTSQMSFEDITSKEDFIRYIRDKLETIAKSNSPVFAELGELDAYGHKKCVVLAQGTKDNLIGTAFLTISNDKVTRVDLCIVPPPQDAVRSGIYPGLENRSSRIIKDQPLPEGHPLKKGMITFGNKPGSINPREPTPEDIVMFNTYERAIQRLVDDLPKESYFDSFLRKIKKLF